MSGVILNTSLCFIVLVFEYQEVFFTHREPIVILKDLKKAKIYSAVGKAKTERNFPW